MLKGRATSLVSLLILVALTGGAVGLSLTTSHSSRVAVSKGPLGDPGGVILTELTAVERALPPGATIIRTLSNEPHFTGSCDSTIPNISIDIYFSSGLPLHAVRDDVARLLAKAGWGDHVVAAPIQGVSPFRGRTVLAKTYVEFWQKPLKQGTDAGAQLAVDIPVSGSVSNASLEWALAASSRAVDGPVMHCQAP